MALLELSFIAQETLAIVELLEMVAVNTAIFNIFKILPDTQRGRLV
ncbi:hypothetical protein GLO73106DRAFT_00020000 [Gloeocapsa sp. PCC 73106]|nr:hypothetical protein GLO73106DRAFT_00020000 [Gloeocapsa sp. PCC 73106]